MITLKKQHRRYSDYKDSGVEWIGEIPSDWEVKKFKYYGCIVAGQSPDNNDVNDIGEGLPFFQGKAEFGKINPVAKNYCTSPKKIAKNGDILISVRAPVGDLNFANEDCCIGRGLAAISSKNQKYFYYVFLFSHQRLNSKNTGSTFDAITGQDIKNLEIVLPQQNEIIEIASYLDEKTFLLDAIIEKKKQQIELLKEKRTALINKAVTRGVPLKVMFDSNVKGEWNKLDQITKEKILKNVQIINTHIQVDECRFDIGKHVSTSGAIVGVSRFGMCCYSTDDDVKVINSMQGNAKKGKHSNDALILATAKRESCMIVTGDNRLRTKANDCGVKTVDFQEFLDSVMTKDSGVEWIGEIPKGWKVAPLKWFIAIGSGEFLENEKFDENGQFNVIGGNGCMGKTNLFNSSRDTLVIGRVGAKCGNIHVVKGNNWITDNALRISDIKKYDINYLALILRLRNLNDVANKSAQPLISGTMVKNNITPLPLMQEQKAIVNYLDIETRKIDQTVMLVEKSISLLQEYKTSLISNAVTGKIKVAN